MREQSVHEGGHRRIHFHGRGFFWSSQDSLTRVCVRYRRNPGDSQPLDERLEGCEKECLVMDDWPSDRPAKLIAFECWNWFVGRVEEVLGIERGIPQKFKHGAMILIAAGTCDCVDHAAGGSSIFSGVGISEHLKFEHSVH